MELHLQTWDQPVRYIRITGSREGMGTLSDLLSRREIKIFDTCAGLDSPGVQFFPGDGRILKEGEKSL